MHAHGRYVTVNESAGRALFYVFAEAEAGADSSLPLVLWLKCAPWPACLTPPVYLHIREGNL